MESGFGILGRHGTAAQARIRNNLDIARTVSRSRGYVRPKAGMRPLDTLPFEAGARRNVEARQATGGACGCRRNRTAL